MAFNIGSSTLVKSDSPSVTFFMPSFHNSTKRIINGFAGSSFFCCLIFTDRKNRFF